MTSRPFPGPGGGRLGEGPGMYRLKSNFIPENCDARNELCSSLQQLLKRVVVYTCVLLPQLYPQ